MPVAQRRRGYESFTTLLLRLTGALREIGRLNREGHEIWEMEMQASSLTKTLQYHYRHALLLATGIASAVVEGRG